MPVRPFPDHRGELFGREPDLLHLLDPVHLELATLNGLLTTLGHHALDHTDLAPLKRAG